MPSSDPVPAESGRSGSSRSPLAAVLPRLRGFFSARRLQTAVRGLRIGALGLILYSVLFNLSVVRGNSMAPGIHDGDRILVGPWSYLFQDVCRGDVVVMRYPLDPTVDYIKRVVGLPGDEIEISAGRVRVNGESIDEPYVEHIDRESYLFTRVREGHYFVLGDNRPRSSDSREFGQVAFSDLRGRVDLRVWPPDRIGLVH